MTTIANAAAAAVNKLNNFGTVLKQTLVKKVPILDATGKADPTYIPVVQGPPGPATYDLYGSINGKPLVNEILTRIPACRSFTIAANFAKSYAICTTKPTNNFQIEILKNNVQIGTITFVPSSNNGIFSTTPAILFNEADQLAVRCLSSTQDATLSDIAFGIFTTSNGAT